MEKKYFIHLFFILLFLGLFLWSCFSIVNKFAFLKNASRTVGVVVKVVEEEDTYYDDDSNARHYSARIQFFADNGDRVEFSTKSTRTVEGWPLIDTFSKNYSIGEQFQVLYSKSHPENAIIDTFTDIWAINIICFLTTGLLLLNVLFKTAAVEKKFITNEEFLKYAYLMNKKGSTLTVEFFGESAGIASLRYRSQLFGSKDIKVIIFTTEFDTLPEDIKLKIQNRIEPWVSKA